ncbi:MAG: nickel pincer cofactor biosynthesis protein LarB [Candidatus Omnitrophica bacterium]|nr:nickel pincer cofactor biosynthesis protein LarB [Candidatus Omnitrophota bacterium]
MYTQKAIEEILKKVSKRKISTQVAFHKLRNLSYESLGFARLDHHRVLRKSLPEVIYAPGKTLEQIEKIAKALRRNENILLITRLEEKRFRKLKRKVQKLCYSKEGKIAYITPHLCPPPQGGRKTERKHFLPPVWGKVRMGVEAKVAIVTAGTSDIPVAEEARITLESLGRKVQAFYDLGVAGLHRLLDHISEIEKAHVIICVAGMEGALPSVLAGLVSKPVIAVPTSVGYGSSFKGVTPLLTMLNSCAQGVAVVNIDSGFSAACFAHLVLNTQQ